MPRFRPRPRGRFPGPKSVLRDPDCDEYDAKGRLRWRNWWEPGLRSYAAVQVPGVPNLVRRLRKMKTWREVTGELLDEMERLARELADLSRWHAGARVEPRWIPPEGPKPRFAGSYARSAAEVARSVALGRARVFGPNGVEGKRPESAFYPAPLNEEESRRRLEEWKRRTGGGGKPPATVA